MSVDVMGCSRVVLVVMSLVVVLQSVLVMVVEFVCFDFLLVRLLELDRGWVLLGDDQVILCVISKFVLGKVLILVDVVDLVLCYQLQIQVLWVVIKLQVLQLGEVWVVYLFNLIVGVGKYCENSSFDQGGSWCLVGMLYVMLIWCLFDFGGCSVNQCVVDVLLQVVLVSQDVSLQKVMVNVVGLYYDVYSVWVVQQLCECSLVFV